MINKILDIDKLLFLFLNNLGTPSWDPFWLLVSNKLCMFFILTCVIFYYSYKSKYEYKHIIYLLILLIGCLALTDQIVNIFKNSFMRLRPCYDPEVLSYFPRILVDCAGEYGFVSGHAATSTSIVTLFILCYRSIHRVVKYALISWVFIVSYSRIYLGKHYMLDVLFGMLLGFLIGFIIFKLYHFYIKKNNKK